MKYKAQRSRFKNLASIKMMAPEKNNKSNIFFLTDFI